MPKLTRYLQKIFASNSNQIGVFGSGINKETSTNLEVLQSQDYEGGWSQAIVTNKNYPIWQEMDGVQYGFSYQLAYLMQNGIPEWLSTETYYANSYCRVGSMIYYSLQDNNTGHNPALGNGWWTPLLTSNRSIGEIIPSCIPLTEAGLHLLDGALITNGMYADFVTYIANLTATAPDIFCTEAEWQQSVTTYGVCGKFVYDSVNNTVRLPKITGIVEGTTDLTALGDLVQAGLPNITGGFGDNIGEGSEAYGYTGAFALTNQIINTLTTTQTDRGGRKVDFDASRSSSIYGNSSTVQPQTIKVLYYIVIATSTKTDIEVDIDEIATDLNGKADVDLTNVTNVGNIKMANASMPSSHKIQLTTGASGTAYTAPADGYLYAEGTLTAGGWIIVSNDTFRGYETSVPGTVDGACEWIPIRKGSTGYVYYINASSLTVWFIYAVGSESEAN